MTSLSPRSCCDQTENNKFSTANKRRSFFSPRSCCDQTEISLLHINDRGLLAVGSAASTCARCVLAAIDFGPLRSCAGINSTAIKTRASTASILIAASSQRGNSELAVSIWAILFLLGIYIAREWPHLQKTSYACPFIFPYDSKKFKIQNFGHPFGDTSKKFRPPSQLIQIVCPRGFAPFATHPNSFAPPPLNSKNKKWLQYS